MTNLRKISKEVFLYDEEFYNDYIDEIKILVSKLPISKKEIEVKFYHYILFIQKEYEDRFRFWASDGEYQTCYAEVDLNEHIHYREIENPVEADIDLYAQNRAKELPVNEHCRDTIKIDKIEYYVTVLKKQIDALIHIQKRTIDANVWEYIYNCIDGSKDYDKKNVDDYSS